MLGEQAIAAAVGFAGVVGFFHMSIYIGLLIGITACVSRTGAMVKQPSFWLMYVWAIFISAAGLALDLSGKRYRISGWHRCR